MSDAFGVTGWNVDDDVDALTLLSVNIHCKSEGHDDVPLFFNLSKTVVILAIFLAKLYSALVRATLAPQPCTILANIWSVSRRVGLGGKTGTAMTPALRQAKNAIIKSNEGGYTKTARSPGCK